MTDRVSLALALAVGVAACAHEGTPLPVTVAGVVEAPPPGELALGPGDTFDVRVFGEPELTNTYRVGADGTIDYPLIGQLRVEGLEPHHAANLIANKLAAKYLKNPQVSVLVKDQPSKKVSIIGQVTKPGTYPFSNNMNVIEAITIAGGFTPISAKDSVTIKRIEGGRESFFEVHVAEISKGKERNVQVRPGDIISVPERIF